MRHIDHIVVAVRELDEAADIYRRLGFQVGTRNQHPWGTENRLIQFGRSFIELITVGNHADLIPPHQERRFSFGAFVRDCLRQREGIAMLALSSTDAEADAAQFAERGIGNFEPFFFARRAARPDGSETDVAFALAFAKDPAAPDVGFFLCQQHFPENFWNRSFQQHPNSARDIAAVTLTAPDPKRHAEFLARFSGQEGQSLPGGSLRFALDGDRIEVVPAAGAQTQLVPGPLLTALSVRVETTQTLEHLLSGAGIPFVSSDVGVVISATSLLGIELRFETNTK